jgi:hypothetical protein
VYTIILDNSISFYTFESVNHYNTCQRKRYLSSALQGQIGLELAEALRNNYGHDNVVCADVKDVENPIGPYEKLDAMDRQGMYELIKNTVSVKYIYWQLSFQLQQNKNLNWLGI